MRFDNEEFWSLHDAMPEGLSKSEKETYFYYYIKFARVAMSRVGWDFPSNPGLGAVIESLLWRDGECIVFEHPQLGIVATPCSHAGYDINARPSYLRPQYDVLEKSGLIDYRPVLERYRGGSWSSEKCVHITDTTSGTARSRMCIPLLKDICYIKEAIRTQIFNQNSPLFVVAKTSKEKHLASRVIKGIGEGQKIFVLDDNLADNMKFFTPASAFNVPAMIDCVHEIENEVLEFLAVDCTQVHDKKERMIVDEVESNDEILQALEADIIEPRQQASELLNKAGIENTLYISSPRTVTE